MTRKVDVEAQALRILRRLAEAGDADAAGKLALHARRAKRESKTQAKRDAVEAQRNATKVSRATSIVGPEQRDNYTERALAWLMLSDEEQAANPAEGTWLDAVGEEYRQACEAFPWPDDRSPAEVAAQEQMDAGQRDVAAWFQRGAARPDAGRRRSAQEQQERAARAVLQERAARAEGQPVHPPEPASGPPTPIGSPRRSAARQKPTTEPQED